MVDQYLKIPRLLQILKSRSRAINTNDFDSGKDKSLWGFIGSQTSWRRAFPCFHKNFLHPNCQSHWRMLCSTFWEILFGEFEQEEAQPLTKEPLKSYGTECMVIPPFIPATPALQKPSDPPGIVCELINAEQKCVSSPVYPTAHNGTIAAFLRVFAIIWAIASSCILFIIIY